MNATVKEPLFNIVTRTHYHVVEHAKTMAIVADPFKQYPRLNEDNIMQVMGFIPTWMLETYAEGETWAVGVCKRYIYGDAVMTDSHIDEFGYMTYPGDPDLAPIALGLRPDSNEILLQYPHGIVAFISPEGEQKIVRMD